MRSFWKKCLLAALFLTITFTISGCSDSLIRDVQFGGSAPSYMVEEGKPVLLFKLQDSVPGYGEGGFCVIYVDLEREYTNRNILEEVASFKEGEVYRISFSKPDKNNKMYLLSVLHPYRK